MKAGVLLDKKVPPLPPLTLSLWPHLPKYKRNYPSDESTHLEAKPPIMLMPTVDSSIMFIKKRSLMEVIPPSWRNMWTEWQLRVLVLFSLSTQIILVVLGKRRKRVSGSWIRFTVWSAYLLADSIALMAAVIISNELGGVYDANGLVDPKHELVVFWAPILLLHLGGTDTIYTEVGDFIEEHTGESVEHIELKEASKKLSKVKSEVMLTVGGRDRSRRDRSNNVIFHACRLVSALGEDEKKWELIKNVWLEMLGHAASQCEGRLHAQQLRRRGELLSTHSCMASHGTFWLK